MTEDDTRKLHNLLRATETALYQVWIAGENPKEWVAIARALTRRAINIMEETV